VRDHEGKLRRIVRVCRDGKTSVKITVDGIGVCRKALVVYNSASKNTVTEL